MTIRSVPMINRPPWDMASRALTARFIKTCSIIPSSASIAGRLDEKSHCSLMSSPMIRPSMLVTSPMTSLNWTGPTLISFLRLKVSNWRVRLAALSPAL